VYGGEECVERPRGPVGFESEKPVEIAVPFDGVGWQVPAKRAGACRSQGGFQALLTLAQSFLRSKELFFGPLSGEQDAVGVLQRDRTQPLFFLVRYRHYDAPSAAAARAVPCTRARILANAVSRVVDASSQLKRGSASTSA